MPRPTITPFAITVASFGIAACSFPGTSSEIASNASARVVDLVASDGSSRGSVTLQEARGGSTLTVKAVGLSAGQHGIHLHERGQCEGPGFASAGGHWNPTGRKHGRDNPAGAHIGDLPNLRIDVTGSGTASFTLAPGSADADGTALVIHEKADDYRTDPSGNSGNRVACAVIAAPQ